MAEQFALKVSILDAAELLAFKHAFVKRHCWRAATWGLRTPVFNLAVH